MKINSRSYIILLVIIPLVISCAIQNNKAKVHYEDDLPGVHQINNILFCDETEQTNFQWLEYLYWIESCFGEDSKEYKNALPQDSIWQNFRCLKDRDTNEYFRHPAYRDFPLVGITQQQARNFASWRSDRVFEYLSI